MTKERARDDGETYESWLAAVVDHILLESGIRGVIVGNRILDVFRSKISSLCSAFKRAKSAGGKSFTRLLNRWELGPKYTFTVYYDKLEVVNLENENRQLKGEKRALEQSLEEEKTKRIRAEEDLKTATNMVKQSKEAHKKKFKQLVNKVAKLSSNKKSRGPDKNKSFGQYSRKQQARVRKQLKEQCQTTLSFLGHYNYVPSRIELYNHDTGMVEHFTFSEDNELQCRGSQKEISEEEMDRMNMWLYLKDKFNISNEAWHEIAMASNEPPCLNRITKHMKKINQKWNLKSTPGQAEGVQVSFQETIVEHIHRLKSSGIIQDGEQIKIKLSGDGPNIGKRISVVNITFTILNEKRVAMSEKGNYLLAVLRTNKSYDTLAESLSDLVQEMQNLKEISVDNETFYFEYFLGGDWKFLACVCGIWSCKC